MYLTDSESAIAYISEIGNQMLLARAMAVVAEFGIADLVAEGPKSVDELAVETRSDRDALYRILRSLAGHGFFAEDESGRIGLTASAEVLKADHPDSVRDLLCLGWQNIYWDTYRALPDAVRSGQIAFDRAFGRGIFDYLKDHPELNAIFDRRMARVSLAENRKIVDAYPFGECVTVVDVGGGRGGLLTAILERYADIGAALYEQPQVLSDPADLREAGVLGKVELLAGDFFDSIPAGRDIYILKRIIHDWDDADARRILGHCRDAAREQSRILVIDAVMKPGNEPDPNKDMDLNILALTPGRERTEAEFRALFEQCDLELEQIVATEPPSTLSIVEARRRFHR
jgi:hypothetical protein